MFEYEKILNDIWRGTINLFNLPLSIYTATSNKLLQGVTQGYGGGLVDFDLNTSAHDVLKKLHLNIYEFSGAKTFQEVRSVQRFIFDEKGFKRSFAEFEKDASRVFETYNRAYLETEFNTATSQAYSARQWQDIIEEKETFPYLRYQTVNDGRVRDEHAILDDIVKPVNDSFWDSHMPPNDWNCRCIVIQEEGITNKDEKKNKSQEAKLNELKKDKDEYNKKYPKLFRENPGKTGRIFKKTHPYYNVPKKYQEYKKNNFELPIPQNL